MKILCVIEHGDAPSTRLRLRDCLELYAAAGVQATVLAVRSSWRERLRAIREASRHDAVVLFKAIGFTALQLQLLRRANPRIIFDFDDAVMFRELKEQQPIRGRNFAKFLRTIDACAAVAAGNNFLARFAETNCARVVVLPTPIDVGKYRTKEPHDGIGLKIGWLGLSAGLPYVRAIAPALQQLAREFPAMRLRVICDRPLALEGVMIENETWRLETEQANLAGFDMGIMPLWDSLWTRGKCAYKILQYMGVGTPAVASPVGMNSEVIAHGVNGFLASTNEEWIVALRTLMQDAAVRREFGLRGREAVEQRYSLEAFTSGYLALFREVAARR